MKVAILTSSRADYGIYKPLISALNNDPFFHLSIIAFGSHLSPYHGRTVNEILRDGFKVDYNINSLLLTDDENSIATAIGLTTIKFAEFWENHSHDFDLVFCLGDRFEMFAAVIAGLSYSIRFAHIHGGETTLGAIDNVFRHAISMSAKLHFTATQSFADKVKLLTDAPDEDIIVSGALSLDNLQEIKILTVDEFYDKWKIDLSIPSVLITIHPETVNPGENYAHLDKIIAILKKLKDNYQLILTMPNTDTFGTVYRNSFIALGEEYPGKIKLIENFGTQSYFSCIKETKFMLGNTSSGIIEAASFNKYVINIGDRQKGRLSGENVLNVSFNEQEVLKCVKFIEAAGVKQHSNIYDNGGAVKKIIAKLKKIVD